MSEPAWMTFAILGMIDAGSAAMIEQAVRSVDPAANVVVALSPGLASVRSAAPAARIRAAIEAQGFIAEPRAAVRRAQAPISVNAVLSVFGRALLSGLICALIVPLVTFLTMLGLEYFDRACGTPGDSGGCEMGLVSTTVLSIAPGAMLGFLITLVHGFIRIARQNSKIQNGPPR
jgi:uncharacterized YccA/Bax inhibitor family protein